MKTLALFWRAIQPSAIALLFVLGAFFLVCLGVVHCGCTPNNLNEARTAWNVGNDIALHALDVIETEHQKAADACHDQTCLDAVKERWHPAYVAFRSMRTALASARVVLSLADPTPVQIATVAVELAAAQAALVSTLADLGVSL